jgi:uncharacterized membrane protein
MGGPETGPAEPSGSAGPVSPWYREEFLVEQDYRAGPLPSPSELRQYGEVDPRAPAIIFREFEQESGHRREIEWAIVSGESKRADRGQLFALAVLLSGLLIGGFLVYTNHDVAGSVIAGADLVAGAALFIRESRGSGTPEPEGSR